MLIDLAMQLLQYAIPWRRRWCGAARDLLGRKLVIQVGLQYGISTLIRRLPPDLRAAFSLAKSLRRGTANIPMDAANMSSLRGAHVMTAELFEELVLIISCALRGDGARVFERGDWT
jgi:hypothetical protein